MVLRLIKLHFQAWALIVDLELILKHKQTSEQLQAPESCWAMHAALSVKLKYLGLTPFDVLNVEVEDVREPRPKHIDGDLLEEVVQHTDAVVPLHQFLALLVDLGHYQAAVQIEKLSVHVFLQLVEEVLVHDVLENAVVHEGLLGLVANLKVKEVNDEKELLGHSVRHQLNLTAEHFFNRVPVVLLLRLVHHYWVLLEEGHHVCTSFVVALRSSGVVVPVGEVSLGLFFGLFKNLKSTVDVIQESLSLLERRQRLA